MIINGFLGKDSQETQTEHHSCNHNKRILKPHCNPLPDNTALNSSHSTYFNPLRCCFDSHLQVSLAPAAQCELAIQRLDGEKGGPAIKGQHPGAIGATEGEVSAGRDGPRVGELQHRVFNVADDLMVLLQELLQLLDAVLQHRNLALKRPGGWRCNLSTTSHD